MNEAFVRKFSPGRDLVGTRLRGSRSNIEFEIIGVVADVRENGLDASVEPRIYLSFLQRPNVALAVFLRSRNDVQFTRDALIRTVHEVDPDLPTFGVRTMHEVVSQSMARRRFSVSLMSGFALAAVLLAALGIYGVMSFLVGQRGQEFGLRQALGATRRDIMKLAFRARFRSRRQGHGHRSDRRARGHAVALGAPVRGIGARPAHLHCGATGAHGRRNRCVSGARASRNARRSGGGAAGVGWTDLATRKPSIMSR